MIIDKLQPLTDVFDWMHQTWERPGTQRRVALLILWVYIFALIGIELNRCRLLPPALAQHTPLSHFAAIHLAFTLILGLEVMSLIFSISSSISRSVGKQFEILTLILLRNAFKELSALPEPVTVAGNLQPILYIALSGFGALCVFACLCVYMRMVRPQRFIQKPEMRMRYVMSKKLLSLSLFVIFFGFMVRDARMIFLEGAGHTFFEVIYTVLIFADIALVLIAQRYMPAFQAVFRNSGFVIGTLLMRLALSAEQPWDTVVSIVAALYVLGLTWVTNYFLRPTAEETKKATPRETA
ncbi:MAG: hypothetical protein LBR31_06315 [Desulfovibrio sp.]|jgi:hypothetical protein|nr:hypothetical protein [Desulfovibrio sp.]